MAIAAAAIGGGTAYAFQELTGNDTVATSSSTSTNVVPSGKKGDVSGVAAAGQPEHRRDQRDARAPVRPPAPA